MRLREYQHDCAAAFADAWSAGMLRCAAVLATGLGKTVIMAELARRAVVAGQRVLVLVHRDELATQAAEKFRSAIPWAKVGTVKGAGNFWNADVVIASVPTIARAKRISQIPSDHYGLGLVDECHHSAAASWSRTMDYFGGIPWAGFTATLARGDSKSLGKVWERVVYTKDVAWGIEHGYLTPVTGLRVQVESLDLATVKRSRGDYISEDLGSALINADAGHAIARAYTEYADNRRAVLFLPNVATVQRFTEILCDEGVPAEYVLGDTDRFTRANIFDRFRSGETRVLSSCMVLTEGFDAPHAEVAIMARPTSSAALYTQCVGRVLRPSPDTGKSSALVLDLVGASKHSLATLVDLVGSAAYPGSSATPARSAKSAPATLEALNEELTGNLTATKFDLYEKSPSRWLRTSAGLPFIPTAVGMYYLWSNPAGYGAGLKYAADRAPGHGAVLRAPVSELADAVAWLQDIASADGSPYGSLKGSSWRRKKPSDKMAAFAERCGIDPWGLSAGELSDRLAILQADQILPKPKGQIT
jgi:superfamily II DNA or RNA helicase